MAKKKSPNILAIVYAGLILVGLILEIVGMCTPILSSSALDVSAGLFGDGWEQLERLSSAAIMQGLDMPSRTFTVVAFIVALVGTVTLIAYAALKLVGKDIKILGLIGGAVTVVGAILVLIAGLVLAGDFNKLIFFPNKSVNAGVGIWLGFIGGLVVGAAGLLSAFNIGSKK